MLFILILTVSNTSFGYGVWDKYKDQVIVAGDVDGEEIPVTVKEDVKNKNIIIKLVDSQLWPYEDVEFLNGKKGILIALWMYKPTGYNHVYIQYNDGSQEKTTATYDNDEETGEKLIIVKHTTKSSKAKRYTIVLYNSYQELRTFILPSESDYE